MSLFVFSSVSLCVSSRSSRSSGVTRGRFPTLPAVLPPPRLTEEELEVELRPESTTGDACHSRRKSGASGGERDSFLFANWTFSGCHRVLRMRGKIRGCMRTCVTYETADTLYGSWT